MLDEQHVALSMIRRQAAKEDYLSAKGLFDGGHFKAR